MEQIKVFLDESEMPRQWYNILADLPTPMRPPLHPATGEPVKPEDLAPVFPMNLIEQEMSTERWIEIPEPVLEKYAIWRPTPLYRARNLEKALERQHYVLERMVEVGFLSPEEAVAARKEPLDFADPEASRVQVLNSFTEEVRRRVEADFGSDVLYGDGLSIHTTLDLEAQRAAEAAVQKGLEELDKRHGYRGPHGHVEGPERDAFLQQLAEKYRNLASGAVVEAVVQECPKGGMCRLLLGRERTARLLPPEKEKWAAGYFKSRKKGLIRAM